jgi:hypothetical protein
MIPLAIILLTSCLLQLLITFKPLSKKQVSKIVREGYDEFDEEKIFAANE